MSARAPRQRLIGVIVAIVLLLLIGWAATHRSGSVEDRHDDTVAALRTAGVRQARADVEGMEVTVYGVADDRHMREVALREVRAVAGVRMVTDRLVVSADDSEPSLTPAVSSAEPGPPTLAPTATVTDPAPVAGAAPPASAGRASATTPTTRSSSSRSPAPTDTSGAPCSQTPGALQGQSLDFVDQSATLAGASINTLAAISRHLSACPDALLEIRAFADHGAGPAANLRLSRQRANVVVGHLSRDGVATHRLVATYRGDRAPGGNRALLTVYPGKQQ